MSLNYDVAPLPGYHPEIGLLLACLDDSTREWRENLGEPPVEAIVWQPWPKAHSIGALLLHMIDCEKGWFENFAAGLPEDPEEARLLMSADVQQDGVVWPVPHSKPIEWYVDLLSHVRERVRRPLREMDPAAMHKGGSNVYTLRWIVGHVVQHDAYHGGQAVLLHELWKQRAWA